MTEQNLHTLPHNEPSPPAVAKAGMTAGGAIAALVPQNLDDAFRLSKALAASGDMVPKHFQGKPEMVMAAIVRGMEIGLAPMQALSNIAVINGRASIWGDALPALMQRAGHQLDCEVTGEGDSMVATATLVRGDTGQRIVRSFSAADAKAAGLWGKQGPWQTHKPRMLSMRARSYACRDGAADALMGLQVAEEASDMTPIRDVTPKEPGGFAQKAAAARKPEAPAIVEGEVMPAEVVSERGAEANPASARDNLAPAHWTDGYEDFDEGELGSLACDEGAYAFKAGKPKAACPYDESSIEAADWLTGWFGARKAAAQ